jgi:hypothetical protein
LWDTEFVIQTICRRQTAAGTGDLDTAGLRQREVANFDVFFAIFVAGAKGVQVFIDTLAATRDTNLSFATLCLCVDVASKFCDTAFQIGMTALVCSALCRPRAWREWEHASLGGGVASFTQVTSAVGVARALPASYASTRKRIATQRKISTVIPANIRIDDAIGTDL